MVPVATGSALRAPCSGLERCLVRRLATAPAQGLVLSTADRGQLQRQLEGLIRAEDVKDIPVEFAVAEGDVAVEILAEAGSADMVVMGTHGRTAFDHVVLGSVAEKVLRKVNCSVLTVPRGSPDGSRAVPSLFPHPRSDRFL